MGKLHDEAKIVLSKSKYAKISEGVDELIESIDNGDGEFEGMVITHLDVFNNGSSTFVEYIKACEFITHYYNEHSKLDSWKLTFPDRFREMDDRGADEKDVRSRASAYFRGQLVQSLIRQSAVSLGIFYAGYSHKAVQKLFNLMENSGSDRIQMESADKLLGHLKEVGSKNQLDLNVNVTHKHDFIGDIETAMEQMITKQKAMITAGMDLKSVANARIGSEPELIEAELDDGTES